LISTLSITSLIDSNKIIRLTLEKILNLDSDCSKLWKSKEKFYLLIHKLDLMLNAFSKIMICLIIFPEKSIRKSIIMFSNDSNRF